MITVTPQELERDLAVYLDRVKASETLIVSGVSAELEIVSNFDAPQLRPIGLAAGQFVVPDDFDDSLPDDFHMTTRAITPPTR